MEIRDIPHDKAIQALLREGLEIGVLPSNRHFFSQKMRLFVKHINIEHSFHSGKVFA